MSTKPLTVHQLREMINDGDLKDPIIFLESVMNGQDPREFGELYQLVVDIEDFCEDGVPSSSEWAEVVDLVITRFKYRSVGMNDSMVASKTLMEYLHPKKKQIEATTITQSSNHQDNPLTEEEIIMFREKFNDEF